MQAVKWPFPRPDSARKRPVWVIGLLCLSVPVLLATLYIVLLHLAIFGGLITVGFPEGQ